MTNGPPVGHTMSHETPKTLIFVAVAAALMGAALVNVPDRRKDAVFSENGQPFFPDFKDPNACTSLEVVDYDPETTYVTPFKVQLKDGKWTVPSHYDYPADGKDRLVKTSAGVMDLRKDKLSSESVAEQEKLGVVDPLDAKATTLKGQGKRVTLKDASDKVLADFIVGKEVEGHPGQRYVRVPGQKPTYAVNVKLDLSSRFADWIETNLLKLDTGKVRKVAFNSQKLEVFAPGRAKVIPGEVVTIERKDSMTPWSLLGPAIPEGKELDTDKLAALTTALGDVKIVGVRPKPPGLTRELVATGDIKDITKLDDRTAIALATELYRRGYYLAEGGRVLSNQGDIVVSTEDGAVYTLRFGEAYIASGEALSKGIDDAAAEAAKKDQGKESAKDEKKSSGIESRYLLATIAFDPRLLPPLPDPDAGRPLTLPDDVFKRNPGEPQYEAQQKLAQEKADRRKAEEDKRVAEAEKKVKELSDRFAGWYYLTPNESFKSLALDRTALVREKGAKPPGGAPGGFPGGFPGGGGFPGMPGGLGRPANPHGDD
jgi:hypothetical protein